MSFTNYQSGTGSDGAQYVAVNTSEQSDDTRFVSSSLSSSSSSSSAGGATKKTVAAFVGAIVVACLFVAALTSTHSTPAISAAAPSTDAASDLAKKEKSSAAAAVANEHNTEVCDDPNYSSETLKLAHEMSVVALLAKPEAADPGPVFETSCILNIGDWFYAVSDDSPAIAKIRTRLTYNDPANKLIPPSKPLVDGPQTEMGFEALFYDEKTEVYTAVIEAVPLEGAAEATGGKDGGAQRFHSMLYDFKIRSDDSAYDVVGACPANYEFISGNKGFEGAALVRNSKGEEYVLGMCEGNFCEGGKRGRTPGNGRVVLLKRQKNLEIHGKTYECGWAVVQIIEVPKSVAFRDYSAITLYGSDPKHLRVAIASQENSAVWIGHLNADTWEFDESAARLFDFPRDSSCEVVYCNVEGLDFLNDNLLVAASDQMKNAGRQASRCLAKDQSIHVFVIPPVPEAPEEEAAAPAKEEGKEKAKEKADAKGKGKAAIAMADTEAATELVAEPLNEAKKEEAEAPKEESKKEESKEAKAEAKAEAEKEKDAKEAKEKEAKAAKKAEEEKADAAKAEAKEQKKAEAEAEKNAAKAAAKAKREAEEEAKAAAKAEKKNAAKAKAKAAAKPKKQDDD